MRRATPGWSRAPPDATRLPRPFGGGPRPAGGIRLRERSRKAPSRRSGRGNRAARGAFEPDSKPDPAAKAGYPAEYRPAARRSCERRRNARLVGIAGVTLSLS